MKITPEKWIELYCSRYNIIINEDLTPSERLSKGYPVIIHTEINCDPQIRLTLLQNDQLIQHKLRLNDDNELQFISDPPPVDYGLYYDYRQYTRLTKEFDIDNDSNWSQVFRFIQYNQLSDFLEFTLKFSKDNNLIKPKLELDRCIESGHLDLIVNLDYSHDNNDIFFNQMSTDLKSNNSHVRFRYD